MHSYRRYRRKTCKYTSIPQYLFLLLGISKIISAIVAQDNVWLQHVHQYHCIYTYYTLSHTSHCASTVYPCTPAFLHHCIPAYLHHYIFAYLYICFPAFLPLPTLYPSRFLSYNFMLGTMICRPIICLHLKGGHPKYYGVCVLYLKHYSSSEKEEEKEEGKKSIKV